MLENELNLYKVNIQGNKAQAVQLVRQAEVNAVIAHCCIEDLTPV